MKSNIFKKDKNTMSSYRHLQFKLSTTIFYLIYLVYFSKNPGFQNNKIISTLYASLSIKLSE